MNRLQCRKIAMLCLCAREALVCAIQPYQRWLVIPTLSHGNSYVFYEVANSYDLTCTILYDLSKV